MGWWLLRLLAKLLSLLRLSVNFFSLTVNSQFKNNLCEKAKADKRTPSQEP